jgi:hypothetical protein
MRTTEKRQKAQAISGAPAQKKARKHQATGKKSTGRPKKNNLRRETMTEIVLKPGEPVTLVVEPTSLESANRKGDEALAVARDHEKRLLADREEITNLAKLAEGLERSKADQADFEKLAGEVASLREEGKQLRAELASRPSREEVTGLIREAAQLANLLTPAGQHKK